MTYRLIAAFFAVIHAFAFPSQEYAGRVGGDSPSLLASLGDALSLFDVVDDIQHSFKKRYDSYARAEHTTRQPPEKRKMEGDAEFVSLEDAIHPTCEDHATVEEEPEKNYSKEEDGMESDESGSPKAMVKVPI